MQYFTPELFVRLQNLKDRSAPQEWDRAAEHYTVALNKTLPKLPAAVRKLAVLPLLHDAEILCIFQVRDNLSITLLPESGDGDLIVLSYSLVEEPRVNTASFPEQYRTEYVSWMYDEIGPAKPVRQKTSRPRGTKTGNGQPLVFCHDILLSNGWELLLRFRQVKVARPQRLLPVPSSVPEKSEGKFSWSA